MAGVVNAAIVFEAVCRGALLVALVVTALVRVSRSLLGRLEERPRRLSAALLVAEPRPACTPATRRSPGWPPPGEGP